MISVTIDQKKLSGLLGSIAGTPGNIAIASSRAINKTLTSTKAEMVRVIRQRYEIKAGDIRKELIIARSARNRLIGRVHGKSSSGVPLIKFTRMKRIPSTRRTARGRYIPKKGIPVKIRKDKGSIAASGVFLAKMKSGHVGAFKRARINDGRLPIREVFGPSPVKLLGFQDNLKKIDTFAQQTMDKNLEREVNFILIKMGLR